jgi:tetratricopeptide (TPR) repeat protein
MTWLFLLASAVLAGVGVAGVLAPLVRSGRPVERGPDPLEEERRRLMRSLHELEEERLGDELPATAYRELRDETEFRAVAVLRALEAQHGAGAAGRPERIGPTAPRDRRPGRTALTVLVGAAVLAATVPLLAGAIRDRDPGQPITGGALASDTLAFFQQRVRDHPRDLAARLDLARRFMSAGDVRSAVEQYLTALQLDPRNPEARANLGFLLYQAGQPGDGLKQVEEALDVEPGYPEGLYFKGVILLRGLDRPGEAAEALRAYLEAAPFGSRRAEVERLLGEAERG